jgi:ketol-acid reductoisomerase
MAKIDFGGVVEEVITSEEFSLEKHRRSLKMKPLPFWDTGFKGRVRRSICRTTAFGSSWGSARESVLEPCRGGWLCTGRNPVSTGRSGKTCDGDPVSGIRCGSGGHMARGQEMPQSGGCPLFFPRVCHHLQGSDGDRAACGCGCDTGGPKGSGKTVRRNFLAGSGINSSYAVFQDYTGRALERTLALGVAIGSGYLFPTTFEKEVFSDLTGERGVLMGCLAGVMEAQYDILRKNGHSPSEAFNETVEELTQSLIRLVAENGMDWMFGNCSTTAQRGALDWSVKFKAAVAPYLKNSMTASNREGKRRSFWMPTAGMTIGNDWTGN